MTSINFEVNSNSIEGKSQAILRTNPLLTSNVKLVVDSNGEIYLDSINANIALSDQKYKKFNLDATGNFAYDIASFYSATPLDTVYDTLRRDSDNSVYPAYNKQYEEQYNYGARLNASKSYSENVKFMAPLWIDKKLPGYFVIYRIEEPVSEVNMTDSQVDINNRIINMLANATIVKTFDLSTNSNIGKYLNSFTNDPSRPTSPLTVSFEPDELSTWNGIDLRTGGYTSKAEFIYNDFVRTDREEILNNQFITEGFQRNGLINANLINLEFLFEDFDNAYEVNRYIGIYVNAHEEGSFNQIQYDNKILLIDELSIETNFDLSGSAYSLQPVDMLPNKELSNPILQYAELNNDFYHIRNNSNIDLVYNPLELFINNFQPAVDEYKLKKETLQFDYLLTDTWDFIKLTINGNPNSTEEFIISIMSELTIDGNLNSFTVVADAGLPQGTFANFKFSNQGTTQHVAKAMCDCFRNMLVDLHIELFIIGNEIIIKNYKPGNRLYNFFYAHTISNTTVSVDGLYDNSVQKLDIDTIISNGSYYADYSTWAGHGGSAINSGFMVNESEVGDVAVGSTFIKSNGALIKIVEIVKDPINNLYRVCLEKPIDMLRTNDKSINLWIKNKITFGKFEALDFADFDFNFYDTSNSKLGELEAENYLVRLYKKQVNNSDEFQSVDNKKTAQDYFTNLQGVKTPVTINSSGQTKIKSEYDRLQENYTTKLTNISRVVPNINKWAYTEGVDAKEKPYMLSVSEAFGKTNFSPDITIDGRNVDGMTHEWLYLYKHPKYYTQNPTNPENYLPASAADPAFNGIALTTSETADLVKILTSYIQPEDTINLTTTMLKSITEDWFDRLFVYEGYDIAGTGFAPAKAAQKYVRLRRGSSQAPAEALFRGLKVKLFERKEFTEKNPNNLINTPLFNDYKFTGVLNYNNDTSEDNVNISVIQNKKFNSITLYVEINSTDDEVDFVNRKLLYELNDILVSGVVPDTTINGYLNFYITQTQGNHMDAIGVGTSLLKDIQVNNSGDFNNIEFDYNGDTWVLPIISLTNDTEIRIETIGQSYVNNVTTTNVLALGGLNKSDWSSIIFKYKEGGIDLAKSTFESISAKAIADLLNSNDTEAVKYITIEEDGTENLNRFILNIEAGNNINKSSDLISLPDPNKPDSYKVSPGQVGYYVDDRGQESYNTMLVRMSGEYSPLIKKVATFTDIYRPYKTTQEVVDNKEEERELLIYNRYNRLGIVFASYIMQGEYKYGIIEDLFYHKVNPEKADSILKLSNTSSNLPLYPLIGEVAIDKRDINIFRSSWEDDFYTKNGSNKQKVNVSGTNSTYEESAFLASTLNLPKNQYEITKYNNIKTTSSIEDMKSIKSARNYIGDLVTYEDLDRFYIDMYINNTLTNLLITDDAGISIRKYVVPSKSYGDKTTIDDDIKKYIEVNLLKLLNIDDIKIYTKDTKLIQKSEILSINSLNDILDSGFKDDKNFTIEYNIQNPLNIKLIYNKRPGFRQQFYIYTKIRS
jgi:hypothetical protein